MLRNARLWSIARLAAVAAIVWAAALGMPNSSASAGSLKDGRHLEHSHDFSGLFIGVGGGVAFGDVSLDFRGTSAFNNVVESRTRDAFLSVHGGYQRQIGGVVVGLEVSYSPEGPSGVGTDLSIPPIVGVQQVRVDVSNLFNVNGRVGLTNGRIHVYFTGGYSSAEVRGVYEGISGPFTGRRIQDSQRHDGWNYGFGIELSVARNILVGLEATHTDLDRQIHAGANNFNQPPSTRRHAVDAEFDVIKARVSVQFNS